MQESIAKVPHQEPAKRAKQGRDDHIKQSSIQTPYVSFLRYTVLWKKIPVGGYILDCFYVIIPTLFLHSFPFCYPYILLHFQCFLLLVYVIFLAASAHA